MSALFFGFQLRRFEALAEHFVRVGHYDEGARVVLIDQVLKYRNLRRVDDAEQHFAALACVTAATLQIGYAAVDGTENFVRQNFRRIRHDKECLARRRTFLDEVDDLGRHEDGNRRVERKLRAAERDARKGYDRDVEEKQRLPDADFEQLV